MSVIISRNKKHLALGRLLTKASTQLSYLHKIRTHLSHMLVIMAELEEAGLVFQDHGKDLPPKILSEAKEEAEDHRRIAASTGLLFQAVGSEIKRISTNLEHLHQELDKAEKTYQKSAAKPSKQAMIAQVTEALTSPKDEFLKK